MYIGGVDAAGLHHLVWEIVDNSVDEAMNGHARRSRSRCTRTADGHRRRQRPRHPRRHAPQDEEERARADPHDAARRRQVRAAATTRPPAACTASARSVVNALSKKLVATVRRDGAEWRDAASAGQADRRPEEGRRRARHAARPIYFDPDPTIFRDTRVRPADRSASGSRSSVPPQGPEDRLRGRDDRHEATTFQHDGGVADFLEKIVGRASDASRSHEAPFVLAQGRTAMRIEAGAAVDRVDRRARPLLRQRHPDRRRAARTRTACAPGVVKAIRNYIETHDLTPKGVDAHRRGHPRGRDRRPVRLRRASRSSRARPRTG